DITVYNTDLALALHHERVYSGQSEHIADATRMIALKALEQIPPDKVSGELRAKMLVMLQQ
ncbi:MAG: hypothetical protein M0R66_06560, partial [Candidatus Omnitrophica bacterium]|nr:hypothetical protein [Candidatus Omnitrophota bacterium]